MKNYPEGFNPLVVIGETDGYLTVYTALTNDEVCDILEQAHEAIQDDGFDENVVATLQ